MVVWAQRVGRLTNSVTYQAQIQGFDLAHLNICFIMIYLLEFMKEQFIQIQSYRISTTLDNNSNLKRIPVRIHYRYFTEAIGLEADKLLIAMNVFK